MTGALLIFSLNSVTKDPPSSFSRKNARPASPMYGSVSSR